jgi:hypothetical protein
MYLVLIVSFLGSVALPSLALYLQHRKAKPPVKPRPQLPAGRRRRTRRAQPRVMR